MHHGYYEDNKVTDHQAAQIDMIDRALSWSFMNNSKAVINKKITNIVDVGCGVGGSSRHIATKYGSTGKGISLSNFQIEVAKQLTLGLNLTSKLQYLVADALNMPFPDNSFDLSK